MTGFVESLIPKISGLYTLPWIVVGFGATWMLSRVFTQEKVDRVMKKIALGLLYFFIPPLVFRIFLDTPIGPRELGYVFIVAATISFMYALAVLYARYQIRSRNLQGARKNLYFKTVLTNQGRSSAFVGGIMLAIEGWGVPAAIFMAVAGLALFAVIPYVLHHMHTQERKKDEDGMDLPWFLKLYPWYFLLFVTGGVLLQKTTGISTRSMGDFGVYLRFYTAFTIPAALYYVGSGMHPSDMQLSELRKLLGIDRGDRVEHWDWVRQIFMLTAVFTPLIVAAIFGTLYGFRLIPSAWFAVIVINSILPITSTNIFLVPYGIDRRATAHSVTWTTLLCVPVVVGLIWLFSTSLG